MAPWNSWQLQLDHRFVVKFLEKKHRSITSRATLGCHPVPLQRAAFSDAFCCCNSLWSHGLLGDALEKNNATGPFGRNREVGPEVDFFFRQKPMEITFMNHKCRLGRMGSRMGAPWWISRTMEKVRFAFCFLAKAVLD